MKRPFAGWLVLSLMLSVGAPLGAPSSGAAKVFTEQLGDLHVKVKDLRVRAEQSGRTDEQMITLRQEIMATTSLVHRLGEEAMRANLAVLKKGVESDRSLLLVAQGSEALSFTLGALDNFVDTGDRLFLVLARDGEALALSCQKGL